MNSEEIEQLIVQKFNELSHTEVQTPDDMQEDQKQDDLTQVTSNDDIKALQDDIKSLTSLVKNYVGLGNPSTRQDKEDDKEEDKEDKDEYSLDDILKDIKI